jgi:hypothetical protein
MLETTPGVARPLAAMPLKAQPRPLSRQPEATSLPDLVRNLRPGHRSEEVAWIVLALLRPRIVGPESLALNAIAFYLWPYLFSNHAIAFSSPKLRVRSL